MRQKALTSVNVLSTLAFNRLEDELVLMVEETGVMGQLPTGNVNVDALLGRSKTCQKCQYENSEDSIYCIKCGTKISVKDLSS